jgi:hypothetical protein
MGREGNKREKRRLNVWGVAKKGIWEVLERTEERKN